MKLYDWKYIGHDTHSNQYSYECSLCKHPVELESTDHYDTLLIKGPCKPLKPIETRLDKLGRTIKEGDYVVCADSNDLMIGTIKKINPKMLSVARLDGRLWRKESLKYPSGTVLLDGPDVTMFLLRLTNK